MKVAIYCRVSSEEQRERQTINNQREFAERFCALHQIPIHGFYLDDGVSGTIPLEQREAGMRLLADAQARRIDEVLVYKLDRLGRHPRHILNAVGDLEALGVQVRSMTEAFDTATPAGRFMLSMLAGAAGLERDTIIERSVEGTNRLARQGVWLGGIVPFGYRVVGKDQNARLIPAEEPIDGLGLSEAEVVRMLYHYTVEKHLSCCQLAEHLTALGVPTAYVRDERELLRGKRKVATAGIWRPGRIRNMLVNTTYKGVHQYGKRAKKKREIIERAVPPLVDEATWERAQEVLREHMLYSNRNAHHKYLLRGLMKCGLCGLTYVGNAYDTTKQAKFYYVCNGKHGARGIYGLQGKRCPSKSVPDRIEDTVWQDIEGFLRDPGDVLQKLAEKGQSHRQNMDDLRSQLTAVQQAFQRQTHERNLILGLFRRGRIDEAALDVQLDQIQAEEARLTKQVERLEQEIRSVEAAESSLASAEGLLLELNQKLDQPLTWELKRQLVETLVEGIRVDTVESEGQKDVAITVTYRFGSVSSSSDNLTNTPIANRTGTDSWRRPT